MSHDHIRGQAHDRRSCRHGRRQAAGRALRDQAFTRFGFEWTYEGDSPQQLALAILFDRLGNKERAIQLSWPFMKTVIANLDNDWKLTSEEIDAFVRGNAQAE